MSDNQGESRVLGGSLELLDVLGQGGMGTVYRAYHHGLDKDVVVKLMADHQVSDPEARERFQREARALARLDHPGIVRVHDFAFEGDQPYLVMELVEGGDLSARVPMPPGEFLPVMRAVAEALAYAHAQGMVHRDVKPTNVMMDEDGRVKLTDFGLARLVGAAGRGWTLTAVGQVAGTLHFTAPEALEGADPDPRMDIFSLGALAYQMLTGKPPVGTLEALSGGFDAVVRRALAQDPDGRYQDMTSLLEDLHGLDGAVEAEPESGLVSEVPLGTDLRHGVPTTEDRMLQQAAALVFVAASALVLWAVVVSVTPKVLTRSQLQPLVMIGLEELADGRFLSRARFEVWPNLAAVVGGIVAFVIAALLHGRWRRRGLLGGAPDSDLPATKWMLCVGVAACALYALRTALEAAGYGWATVVIPILGGGLELAALSLFWLLGLEAWRTGESLRDWRFWIGFAMALTPPTHNLVTYVLSWRL